ncbi:MAG TPA: RNA pseudouridine synthase [Spirochaetota bacterium]|nr:RNA pseudouridine synthase [Spirochaetota bacterium]HOM38022.1 RNA pseudouridine synthase [Spirochaetota bacterium]HPQ48826.1 RNA pseudouridine synthase [Spirochaetota bacterium]
MTNFYSLIENNDEFIIVNKSAGISTIKESRNDFCLKSLLESKIGQDLYTVHRLDKDTSGLVIFAKSLESHKIFNLIFENREVYKEYLTVVYGDFPGKMEINYPIEDGGNRMKISENGKYALTNVDVIESFGQFSLLKVILHTGRRHQIRVHLSFLGYPIVGDTLYGYKKPLYLSEIKKKYKTKNEEKPIISRTALHSSKLSFKYKGVDYCFNAVLPKDMKALIYQLRKNFIGANV